MESGRSGSEDAPLASVVWIAISIGHVFVVASGNESESDSVGAPMSIAQLHSDAIAASTNASESFCRGSSGDRDDLSLVPSLASTSAIWISTADERRRPLAIGIRSLRRLCERVSENATSKSFLTASWSGRDSLAVVLSVWRSLQRSSLPCAPSCAPSSPSSPLCAPLSSPLCAPSAPPSSPRASIPNQLPPPRRPKSSRAARTSCPACRTPAPPCTAPRASSSGRLRVPTAAPARRRVLRRARPRVRRAPTHRASTAPSSRTRPSRQPALRGGAARILCQ